MKSRLMAAVVVVFMLTLSACGGSSGGGSANLSGDDAAAAKAISDAIMSGSNSGSTSDIVAVKQSDADCIGNEMVSKIGRDNLVKYKLLTSSNKINKSITSIKMSHGDAVSAADSMTDCTDLKAMMEKAMGSQMSSLPKKAKDCIDKTLTESALHEVFVQVFSGNSSSAGQVLVQPMTKCAQSAMQ